MIRAYVNERLNIAEELLEALKSRKIPQMIFMVGASTQNKYSLRSRLSEELSKHAKYYKPIQIYLPEDLFTELQHDKSYNLLTLENKLAQSVHAVVLCLESAGSLAELGAFSNSDLKDKLIVIQDKKFKKVKSFVTIGPIQYIAQHTNGTILYHNYKQKDIEDLVREIRRNVSKFHKNVKIEFDLGNPIFSIDYVLIMISCFGSVSKSELMSIFESLEQKRLKPVYDVQDLKVSKITKLINKKELSDKIEGELILSKEIILTCQSALTYLTNRGLIRLKGNQFSLTEKGRKSLVDSVFTDPDIYSLLDKLRIRAINLDFINQSSNK